MKTLLLGIHSLVLIVLLSGAVAPVALAQTAPKKADAVEYDHAVLSVEAFCYRVRTEHNVNLTLAHFLKQGTRADLIRFSDTIWEAKDRGKLDDFVKHMADKTRDSCGPVKK